MHFSHKARISIALVILAGLAIWAFLGQAGPAKAATAARGEAVSDCPPSSPVPKVERQMCYVGGAKKVVIRWHVPAGTKANVAFDCGSPWLLIYRLPALPADQSPTVFSSAELSKAHELFFDNPKCWMTVEATLTKEKSRGSSFQITVIPRDELHTR